jgi:hypothetical protein
MIARPKRGPAQRPGPQRLAQRPGPRRPGWQFDRVTEATTT